STVLKNRWTRGSDPLTYWACPRQIVDLSKCPNFEWARRIFGFLPDPLLAVAGTVIFAALDEMSFLQYRVDQLMLNGRSATYIFEHFTATKAPRSAVWLSR